MVELRRGSPFTPNSPTTLPPSPARGESPSPAYLPGIHTTPQDLDDSPQLHPHVLTQRPVDRDAPLDGLNLGLVHVASKASHEVVLAVARLVGDLHDVARL